MKELIEKALSRRNLITAAGVAGASLAFPGSALAGLGKRADADIDVDILNFALNLEYVEAEFYSYAVYGHGISASYFTGNGTPGPTTGGKKVNFGDAKLQAIATEIAQDELNHVILLRGALNANNANLAVAKPAINLLAAGVGFNSPTEFLTLSRAFEDTGVSAYGGAARYITNKDYLEVAARILAVEAYHAGNIRLQLAKPQPGFATDGMDQPPTTTNYIPTDSNSLALIRSTTDVLRIVYGDPTNTPPMPQPMKSFFPNGMNGNIS